MLLGVHENKLQKLPSPLTTPYLCKNSAWESKQVVNCNNSKRYSNNTYKCIGGSVMCRLLY